jgi:hypothetical protein
MPKIAITARTTVYFNKTITAAQLRQLAAGRDLSDFVDESEVYEAQRTADDSEMEWELVPSKRKTPQPAKPKSMRQPAKQK